MRLNNATVMACHDEFLPSMTVWIRETQDPLKSPGICRCILVLVGPKRQKQVETSRLQTHD